MQKFYAYAIPLLSLFGLILGSLFHFAGKEYWDDKVWLVTLVIGTLPLVYRMLKDIFRGHFGVDLIAIAAILTSFALQQYLAGTVILLMLSGGEALEAYALKRSSRELTKLLSLAPTVAHKKTGSEIVDIKIEDIAAHDLLLVKPGETLPADGIVEEGVSEVDEQSITGESLPAKKQPGSLTYSGTVNKDEALIIRALKPAHESQYARIVKLVQEAQDSKAPVVRLADRYAVWFTAITFVLAVGAWLISGESIRFLSVLVVATPCPLILATPIAIISGISKTASRGAIVKNGAALEILGEARALAFDKTGTLTLGEPKVEKITALVPGAEVAQIGASVDQYSNHVFARALVDYAKKEKNLRLELPTNFKESLGNGVTAELSGKNYIFGKLNFLKQQGVEISEAVQAAHDQIASEGKISVYLAQGGTLLGYVSFADAVRPETKQVFASMQEHNIQKMVMLTGDKRPVAAKIAADLGIKDYEAELLPEQKVQAIKNLKNSYAPVAMVGDGVNDAPALAAADVGIAIAYHGSSASSESADIVIMQNNFMRVHDALHIAQRVMRVAKEGIFAGIGISILLMVVAALGYIPPIYGALLQEAIDVAVILNALKINFEDVR